MNSGMLRRRCPAPAGPRCDSGRCGHKIEWRFRHAGRTFTGTEPTERAAHAAMRRAMALAERGELLTRSEQRALAERERREAAARPLFAAYATEWLERRSGLRPRTLDSYRAILRGSVAPVLGGVYVSEVTPVHVRRLLEVMAAPDSAGRVRTRPTLSRAKSLVSGICSAAVADGLLVSNPCRDVKIPEGAAQGRAGQIRAATPGQTAALLALADGSEFYPALRFITATGCRRSEALALRWVNVDLDAGVAVICEGLHQRGGETFVTPPKSKAGRRSVPLDGETIRWLRAYRALQSAEALRWGRGEWNPRGLLFTRRDGTAVHPDSLTHAVKRWWCQLGAPDLGVHSLRHGYATAALAVGADVKVVSDILGHSDVNLTRNVYQHTPPDLAMAAAELIAALHRQAAGSGPTPIR